MLAPWRRWIAALLMVTLPLQAAVAAAGLCCLPGVAGVAGAAEMAVTAATAEAPPCHQAEPDGRAAPVERADAAGAVADLAGDDGRGSCHACAACAVAFAVPMSSVSHPDEAPASSALATPSWRAADRSTPPPDPPPRA